MLTTSAAVPKQELRFACKFCVAAHGIRSDDKRAFFDSWLDAREHMLITHGYIAVAEGETYRDERIKFFKRFQKAPLSAEQVLQQLNVPYVKMCADLIDPCPILQFAHASLLTVMASIFKGTSA